MSNNPFESPGPQQPGQFTNQLEAPKPTAKMPGALMAFAIVGICIGCWNLLGSCCGGGGILMQGMMVDMISQSDKEAGKAMQDILEIQNKYLIINVLLLVVNLIMACVLLFGAISVLRRVSGGLALLRNSYLIFAVLTILALGASIYIQMQIAEEMEQVLNNMPGAVQEQNRQSQYFGVIVNVVMSGLFIAVYFVGWSMLGTSKIKDWCSQHATN